MVDARLAQASVACTVRHGGVHAGASARGVFLQAGLLSRSSSFMRNNSSWELRMEVYQ
jgi:hypothetical protein